MTRDVVKDLRKKYRTHGPPPLNVRRDTLPTDDRAGGGFIEFGVVTEVSIDAKDPSKNHLKWRSVRYSGSTPAEGAVELYGDEKIGYPAPGSRVADYDFWKYPRREFNGRFDFFPMLVVHTGGVSVLVWLDKPYPSPLDTTGADSGCPGA